MAEPYFQGPTGPIISASNVTDLRARDSNLFSDGFIARIPGVASYEWDALSTAADDGVLVLIPDDITHPAPGRWIKIVGKKVFDYTVTSVKTGTYNANIGDLVRVDPSGGGFTVNLPSAAGLTGLGVTIKNVTNSTNTVTIDGDGSETIDGNTTTPLNTAYGSVTVVSDGSNWMRFPAE